MKILISGAYGFVGTNLCRYLVKHGHTCLALDIPKAKRDDVPYKAFYSWDDLDSIDFSGVDAVVHLAGKAHDLKNVSDPQSYFDINVGLTKKFFMACGDKVKTFIFFSSIKAIDNDTPYAQSKREAEKWLGARAIILEPAMIHGPGNKGNLNLLFAIARHGVPWPLAAFENKRSFTSIGNVCVVVEELCRGNVPNGVYPLCDDEPISTNRLIELIAESVGGKVRFWRVPKRLIRFMARVGDVLRFPLNTERLVKLTANAVVDNAKLRSALGWSAMPVHAEDGLRATLKTFVMNEG